MSNLKRAAELLREHYGEQALPGPPLVWTTLVKVVLDRGRAPMRSVDWTWLDATPLSSPAEVALGGAEELDALVESHGYAAERGASLRALAGWIENRSRQAAEDGGDAWEGSPHSLRRQLSYLPGLSRMVIDRILLFVGSLPVYPLDRPSLRMAFRHGWLTEADDPQEAESFFVRGLEDAQVDLAQFSLWTGRLGKDFCGPRPKCENCPLRSMLPASGPYAADES